MSEVLLLDTDVVSYILKNDSRAQPFRPLLESRRLAIAFMTAAELMRWADKRRWGARRRADLEETLQTFAILPPDMEVCRRWADIRTTRERVGRPISVQDAWIAAIALRFDIPLATNNERDFQGITSLEIVRPR